MRELDDKKDILNAIRALKKVNLDSPMYDEEHSKETQHCKMVVLTDLYEQLSTHNELEREHENEEENKMSRDRYGWDEIVPGWND